MSLADAIYVHEGMSVDVPIVLVSVMGATLVANVTATVSTTLDIGASNPGIIPQDNRAYKV